MLVKADHDFTATRHLRSALLELFLFEHSQAFWIKGRLHNRDSFIDLDSNLPMMRSTTATADVTEQIRSPLTGSPHVSLVKTIPTSHLIHQWLRTYRIDVADEFHGLDEIRQYRCNQTGLIFFRPITIAGSPRLYQQLQTATRYYSALSGSTTEP